MHCSVRSTEQIVELYAVTFRRGEGDRMDELDHIPQGVCEYMSYLFDGGAYGSVRFVLEPFVRGWDLVV